MNSYAFNLDLDKQFNDQVVIIGQSDHNGTSMTVTLYEDGTRFTTSGLTAYFAMRLPGGKDYYRKACTYNSGVITVTIDEEYAGASAGRTDIAYFELHQGTSVIASTARFLVIVLPSATQGMSEGQRYDDEIVAAVRQWLDDHPEATTTVVDNSLTTAKLKDRQITEPKMADDAISTRTIIDASVTTPKINDGAVTEGKLAANSVTNAKMADDSVNTAEIVDSAVTTAKLNDGAVTTAKLDGSSVTTAKLDNLAVTEAKLAADAVTRDKLADNAVGTSEIVNLAVTTEKIADGVVTYSKLAGMRKLTTADIDALF